MDFIRQLRIYSRNPRNTFLLSRQIKDYAAVGLQLTVQRQMIFGAALALQAFYYSLPLALLTLVLIGLSELYDYMVFRCILRLHSRDPRGMQRCLWAIHAGTVFSAGIISFFALSIALLQGPTTHFMPLFFLFAAALFAAMNNHQILSVLIVRLLIYGATFLFIPIYDIVRTGAPLRSELWVQFFTSLFVLYFIIDCSRMYMRFYRINAGQMEELQKEHQKTKAAYQSKSEFLATVSHELRTPLTSIKGSLDLVNSGASGPIPERMKKLLTIAQRNTAKLAALIDELLDLQRMDAGKMTFNFAPVQVSSVIAQVISANQPYVETYKVTISAMPVDEGLYIKADQARLEQVIANLLSNAAKFSYPGGHIDVLTEAVGTRVRISVVDRGIGLSEADRQKVFDRFSQLDSSDQRRAGGTGLGMNISKRIMDAHDGEIDYVSNEGAGTTFYIVLDLIEPPAAMVELDATGS